MGNKFRLPAAVLVGRAPRPVESFVAPRPVARVFEKNYSSLLLPELLLPTAQLASRAALRISFGPASEELLGFDQSRDRDVLRDGRRK
jgi:hypothetical protein